jgi:hypothetical protein
MSIEYRKLGNAGTIVTKFCLGTRAAPSNAVGRWKAAAEGCLSGANRHRVAIC